MLYLTVLCNFSRKKESKRHQVTMSDCGNPCLLVTMKPPQTEDSVLAKLGLQYCNNMVMVAWCVIDQVTLQWCGLSTCQSPLCHFSLWTSLDRLHVALLAPGVPGLIESDNRETEL